MSVYSKSYKCEVPERGAHWSPGKAEGELSLGQRTVWKEETHSHVVQVRKWYNTEQPKDLDKSILEFVQNWEKPLFKEQEKLKKGFCFFF